MLAAHAKLDGVFRPPKMPLPSRVAMRWRFLKNEKPPRKRDFDLWRQISTIIWLRGK